MVACFIGVLLSWPSLVYKRTFFIRHFNIILRYKQFLSINLL